jgi:hypothetical protein
MVRRARSCGSMPLRRSSSLRQRRNELVPLLKDRHLAFPAMPGTPNLFRDVPNLMRLINIERKNLGLGPMRPQ